MVDRGDCDRDAGVDFEAMSLERNAPRWLKMLRKYRVHPDLRGRDIPVTLGPFRSGDPSVSCAGTFHVNRGSARARDPRFKTLARGLAAPTAVVTEADG